MKQVLVVVDMQVDFVTGSLGTKQAQDIIVDSCRFIQQFEGPIFVTMDTHTPKYLNTNEGRHLPVMHCIKNTVGWQLEKHIQKALEDKNYTIIEKGQFGSFDLVHQVVKERPDKISIIGICTDICVLNNALLLKTALPEIEIEVYADLTSATSVKMKDMSLELMHLNQIEIRRS